MTNSITIDDILSARLKTYGSFDDHSSISQGIKQVMFNTDKWQDLPDDQKEALEMIAHKIARILNGDSNYKDSWTDIIGYTTLIEKKL